MWYLQCFICLYLLLGEESFNMCIQNTKKQMHQKIHIDLKPAFSLKMQYNNVAKSHTYRYISKTKCPLSWYYCPYSSYCNLKFRLYTVYCTVLYTVRKIYHYKDQFLMFRFSALRTAQIHVPSQSQWKHLDKIADSYIHRHKKRWEGLGGIGAGNSAIIIECLKR